MSRLKNVFDSSWTPPSLPATPLQSSPQSSFDDDNNDHEDAASALADPELLTPCEHHDDSDTHVHPSSDLDGLTEVADEMKPVYRLQDDIDELDGTMKNLQITLGSDGILEAFGGASKRPHPNQLQTDEAKRVHKLQPIIIMPREIEGGFSNVISPSSFSMFDNRLPPFFAPLADTLPTSVDTDGAEAMRGINKIEAEIRALEEATSSKSLITTSIGTAQQSTFGRPDFEQFTRVTGVAGPPAVTRSFSLHQEEVLLPQTYNSRSRSVQGPPDLSPLLSQTSACNPLDFCAADIAPRSGGLQTQLGVCNPPERITRSCNYIGSSAESLSPSDVMPRNHSARSVARGQSHVTMRSPASQVRSSSQDVTFTCGNDDGENDGNAEESLPKHFAFSNSPTSHSQRSFSFGFITSGSSSHSSSSASLSSEYSGSSGSERNSGTELNFQGLPSVSILSKLKGSNCSIASVCSSQLDSGIEGDSPGQSPQSQSPVQSPRGQATRVGDFSPSGPPLLWTHVRIGTRNSMEGISEETFFQHCTSGPQSSIGRRSLSSSSDKSSTSSPVTSRDSREPLGSEGRTCAGMTICSPPSYAQGYRNQQSPGATSPGQYNLPPTPVSPDGNASSPSTVDSIYSHSPNIHSPEASSPSVLNLSIITAVTSPPSSSASLRTLNCGHPGNLTQSPKSVSEHFSPQSQTSPGASQMVKGNSSYSPSVTARSPQGSVFMASSPHGLVSVTNSPCGSVLMDNSPAHYRTEVKLLTYAPAVSPSQIVNSLRVDRQMMNSPRINSPPVNPPQMNSLPANYEGMNSPMVSSTTSPQGIVDYSSTDPDTERGSESPMTNSDCWFSPATPEVVKELSPEQLEKRVIGKDSKWICDLHGETYLHALSGLDDEDMCTRHLFWLHGKGQFIQALNAYNKAYETPLYSAVMFNKPKLTAAFMQVGADVNCQCQTGMHDIQHTPLHLAVDEGRADIVQTLLDSDNIYINAKRRPDNQTPLMVALRKHVRAHPSNDRTRIIDMLLKAAPDLECKELMHQKTALMMAIETKDLNVVRLILESAGVENTRRLINQNRNGSGNTAMHLAAGHNILPQIQSEMLRLLIQYGGDTDVKNSEGATPKDYAKMVIEKVSTRR